jgi:hypothetical protein
MIRFVYIASPYTKGDTATNIRNSLECADKLIELGYIPYAPLLTHLWHLMIPHDYEYWVKIDNAWIEKCDALLRLPGESRGADQEEALMRKLGRPVFHSIGDLQKNDRGL